MYYNDTFRKHCFNLYNTLILKLLQGHKWCFRHPALSIVKYRNSIKFLADIYISDTPAECSYIEAKHTDVPSTPSKQQEKDKHVYDIYKGLL